MAGAPASTSSALFPELFVEQETTIGGELKLVGCALPLPALRRSRHLAQRQRDGGSPHNSKHEIHTLRETAPWLDALVALHGHLKAWPPQSGAGAACAPRQTAHTSRAAPGPACRRQLPAWCTASRRGARCCSSSRCSAAAAARRLLPAAVAAVAAAALSPCCWRPRRRQPPISLPLCRPPVPCLVFLPPPLPHCRPVRAPAQGVHPTPASEYASSSASPLPHPKLLPPAGAARPAARPAPGTSPAPAAGAATGAAGRLPPSSPHPAARAPHRTAPHRYGRRSAAAPPCCRLSGGCSQ